MLAGLALSRASPNAGQLRNFCGNAIVVAAGEACVGRSELGRSSRKTGVCGIPETPHRLISRLLRSRTQASPAATDRVMA